MRNMNCCQGLGLKFVCTVTCCALLTALPSRGASGGSAPGAPAEADIPALRSFPVKGVVRQVVPETQTLLVAHQSIPGFMEAMTMPFRVSQSAFPADLHVGDRISFQLHVTEQQSWIDHISREGPGSGEEPAHGPDGPVRALLPKARHPLLDCRFTNELGHVVTLADFRGQALAITFFFTRCPIPDFCPRLSRNFEEASQRLLALPDGPTNWHFLSFSFDPAYDTQATLKAYAERYHYDPRHWSFLTGAPDKIAQLAAQADVKFQPDNGFFNHNFRTLIIDASGRLQTSFPIGGNLSDAIVSEVLKAAAVTGPPAFAAVQPSHTPPLPNASTPLPDVANK